MHRLPSQVTLDMPVHLWILYLEYVRGKDAEDPERLYLLCDHH